MKRFLASLLLAGLTLLATANPAAAAETLDVEAEINGRDLAGADGDSHIKHAPTETVPITITLRNADSRPAMERFVRREVHAPGTNFHSYDVSHLTSHRT